MKHMRLLVLLLFCAFISGERPLLKTLPATGAVFTSDPMDNIYLIGNEQISKYDSNGSPLKTFSDKTHGAITSADVSNPLRIVLFYRDFSQVAFLDNTMSINGAAINLQQHDIFQPTLVCSSHSNGLWVYDQQNFELIRLNQELQFSQRTGNLAQQVNIDLQPNFLLETNNQVYLNNPSTGILVFDVFGTYYRTIPVRGLRSFQLRGDDLYYFLSSGKLFRYNVKTFEQDSMDTDIGQVLDARVGKERLFVQKSDSLKIYRTQ